MQAYTTQPFNFKKLLDQKTSFVLSSEYVTDQPLDDEVEDNDAIKYLSLDALGIVDEDIMDDGTPFEILGNKMENLTPDGKIKKRVLRKGFGDKPTELSRVRIHYNAYAEFEDTPFDSTYLSRRPKMFSINKGEVIVGLDYSVQSMQLNEKAQFLIHEDYAFKKCQIGRVPVTTCLFEVELLEIVDIGFIQQYEQQLSEEEQQIFSNILHYCQALVNKGNNQYKLHDLKKAIISYNTALARLDKTNVETKDELIKFRDMYLKLSINLLVCQCTVKPRKGVLTAEKIYKFTENGVRTKIPAKVYFCHAKCLRQLNDCESAQPILEKARQLQPHNSDIVNEMIALDREIKEQKEKRKAVAKAMFAEQNQNS